MIQDKLPMTIEGKRKLENELQKLIQIERPAVIKAIEEARAQGDISENAEYDSAKDHQALIEGRIQDIQKKLSSADVIDTTKILSNKVVFGAHVCVEDTENAEQSTYQIVGVDEADVKKGKISILSPLARALIGKQKGDIVVVQSPKGEKEYEIIDFIYK